MTALASSTALPLWLPRAWAQSQSTLSSLPRIALVIGNTNYPQAPLRNPANDAKAIGGELRKAGFQLSLQLDAGRVQLVNAIQQFSGDLAKNKGVGFFYYAGHGAQLESRNYLIPVDAAIDSPEDMRDKAVELNSLLQGLSAARNPMNAIVLDACRGNPFGNKVRIEQRGLSQFDAPPGSLLAYATSPGNTAADGEGENGLYSETLLRELAVPETRIEDVFKRVRLSVRRQSEGRQIPWESTSLEDDFYFRPPEPIRKHSRQELEQQFEAELAIWEKAKLSKDPASLEDYLRRYPSGKFCELAQFRLERLLAQQEKPLTIASSAARPALTALTGIASIAPNPFSKGTFRADANFTIGDSYTYRMMDVFSRAPKSQFTETVTGITDSDVTFNSGERVIDFLGNDLKSRIADFSSPTQFYPSEYAIGRKWAARFRWSHLHALSGGPVEIRLKIARKESITVPAGTFDAFKIEGEGLGFSGERWRNHFWVAPEISRRPVAMEFMIRNNGRYVVADRYELIEFKQKITPAPEGHRMRLAITERLALCHRVTADNGRNYC